MINQVHIQNYKCLRDVTVDLKPLTVLIGPNDSGKTSFLEALRLTSQAVSLDDQELESRSEMRSLTFRCDGLSIEIEVSTFPPEEVRYQLKIDPDCQAVADSLKLNNTSLYSQWIADQEDGSVEFELGAYFPNHPKRGRIASGIDGSKPGWRFFRKAIDGDQDAEIVSVFRCSTIYRLQPEQLRSRIRPTSTPVLASDGSNLADVLHLVFNGPDRTVRGRLEEYLHAEVPALLGIFTPIVESNGQQVLQIEYVLDTHGDGAEKDENKRKSTKHIPCSQVSDGALLLTAFLALAHAETPDILLIEEPENGLHPGRLEMVIDLLRKMTTGEIGNKPRQVILTTHSPLLLNYVDPSEVRVFRRNENGETTVTPMNEVPEIDRLMKTFSPGEIWNLFGEEKMFEGVPV